MKRIDRMRLEDALKHIAETGRTGAACTVQSVAGGLGISTRAATRLIALLESRQLAVPADGGIVLSPAGHRYALSVLRAHRLWERYFSERTGFAPDSWHRRAERKEHRTSRAVADQLSRGLGDPRFDPHGDPIPTATGEMPQAAPRRYLSTLPVGEIGFVVHIEDEPEQTYAELLGAGIELGARVEVQQRSPDQITVLVDGAATALSLVIAANVELELATTTPPPATWPLSALRPGERASVQSIAASCRGLQRQRLLDFGITPGTTVEAVFAAPSGDPVAYRVREAVISLRRSQAELIRVGAAHAAARSAPGSVDSPARLREPRA